ncbi:hypothetical protein BDZ91DRAFT_838989, partial [Kalaharituber pfeilii]
GIGSTTVLTYVQSGVSSLYLADSEDKNEVLTDLVEKCRTVATNLNFNVEFGELNITKEEDVNGIMNCVKETFGRVDYAANIAGVSIFNCISAYKADCTTEVFDNVIDVNIRGAFFCLRAEINVMRTQEPLEPPAKGRFSLFLSSALRALACCRMAASVTTSSWYCIAAPILAALSASSLPSTPLWPLTHIMATSKSVNDLSPGFIDTPLTRRLPEQYIAGLIDSAAQKRLGTTEEVTDMIMFLSGPGASFVTEKDWTADGEMLNSKI